MVDSETHTGLTNDQSNKSSFPKLWEIVHNIHQGVRDMVFAASDAFPSWFDLPSFVATLLIYECGRIMAEYNYILLFLCPVLYVFLRSLNIIPKEDKPSSEVNKDDEQIHGEIPKTAEPPAEINKDKEDQPMRTVLLVGVVIFIVYNIWVPGVRFGIFLYASRKAFEGYKKTFDQVAKAPDVAEETLFYMTITNLGSLLTSKLNAPEPVLIGFFNEAFQKLWYYAKKPIKKYIVGQFTKDLISRLGLIHGTLMHLSGGDSFQVMSVKIVEITQANVIIDIHILQTGSYNGNLIWPSGEQFRLLSFQMEAKYRLNLERLNIIYPDHVMQTFESARIHLKKICKLDTWHDDSLNAHTPLRKRVLIGAEDVIRSNFPLVLVMDRSKNPLISTDENLEEQHSGTEDFVAPVTSTRNLSTPSAAPEGHPNISVSPEMHVPVTSNGTDLSTSDSGTGMQTQLEESINLTEEMRPRPSSSPLQLRRMGENGILVDETLSAEHSESTECRRRNVEINTNCTETQRESEMPSVPSTNTSPDTKVGTTSFGSIEVSIRFQPPRSLVVVIHKLRNIPKKKGKTPHPYVKLVLQSPGKEDLKETTDILDKTTDPVFEKGFRFLLDQPLSQYTLRITVKTKHKLHHALSQVVLGFLPCTLEEVEEKKWYNLESPKIQLQPQEVFYKE